VKMAEQTLTLGKVTTGCKFDERKAGVRYIEITRTKQHLLSPSMKLINWYKNSKQGKEERERYVKAFIKELQSDIDCKKYLEHLAKSKEDICLVCYERERPYTFCHRHIIHKIIKLLRYGWEWKDIWETIEILGAEAGYKEVK